MTNYIRCHCLPDSVGKKNGIVLFFLSRNMNRQKLKEMSYPINSIVTASLATDNFLLLFGMGEEQEEKKSALQ